jgi:type IX secretion system PorP/SprF family membrane protein
MKFNKNSISMALAGLLIFFVLKASGQEGYRYTQYMNNLTPISPVYSLLGRQATANALFHRKYTGIEGAPTTLTFDFSMPVESIRGTLGAFVVNDQIAIERLTVASIFFAKGIQLGEESFLGVALNAGIERYIANYTSLNSDDPLFTDNVTESRPNFGFGVMFYTGRYFIGASVPNLSVTSLGRGNAQDNSLLRNHYNISGAYLLGDGDIKIKPAFLMTYVKDMPISLNVSSMVYLKNTVGLGINYHSDKELAGIFSVMPGNIRLGYSYQFGTSSDRFGGVNAATHELSLSYRFGRGQAVPKLL